MKKVKGRCKDRTGDKNGSARTCSLE